MVVELDDVYNQRQNNMMTSNCPDPLPAAVVKEFVMAGHGQLHKIKEMLTQTPSLLNAAWDWGGGDFETALGGAAHMGNRAIAEFLIAQGARIDIFAAAMLGNLEIVQTMLALHPALQYARGPHGITLLTHAHKGGSQASTVVRYLKSLH